MKAAYVSQDEEASTAMPEAARRRMGKIAPPRSGGCTPIPQRFCPRESIYAASLMRYRIMMTTMVALLGGLPLALGTGAGSELRPARHRHRRRSAAVAVSDAVYYAGNLHLYGEAAADARDWIGEWRAGGIHLI